MEIIMIDVISWRERCAIGEQVGYTEYDESLASTFSTCAVHEQRNLNPQIIHYFLEAPLDKTLYELGVLFMHAIRKLRGTYKIYSFEASKTYYNNIPLPSIVLDRIEDRVLELKRNS